METTSQNAGTGAIESAVSAVPRVQHYPVQFTGSGGEYFRIWIVNLLLTIVTLGIYSAWAKVRRLQYFYRNTRVDGSVFDYHGKPGAILKGRMMAGGLIVGYNVALEFSFVAGAVMAVVFAAAVPWLLVQSQRFRLHNSSYRGLRFAFKGPVREAYVICAVPLLFVLIPLVMPALLADGGVAAEAGQQASADAESPPLPLPLGLIIALGGAVLAYFASLPYLHYRLKRFQHANTTYGHANGRFRARVRSFYKVYGIALLMAVVTMGALGGLLAGGSIVAAIASDAGMAAVLGVAAVIAFYGVLLAIGPFVMARTQNLVWNHSLLGLVGFESRVKARRLIFIVITNLLLIVLTLGLYTPFAAVRLAKYKLESVTVLSTTDLAGFVARQRQGDVNATGEGAADLLEIDFAV